ncbi:hypothetical protein Q8F55_006353 [Vanrija albida]|uniref:Uncharacterized protein n=1 Tax=Vanrija albida TaxID=181172 RepID=A0ABR3PWW8_9TREE
MPDKRPNGGTSRPRVAPSSRAGPSSQAGPSALASAPIKQQPPSEPPKAFLGAYTKALIDPITIEKLEEHLDYFVVDNGLIKGWSKSASPKEQERAVDLFLSTLPPHLAFYLQQRWDRKGGRTFDQMLDIAENLVRSLHEADEMGFGYTPILPEWYGMTMPKLETPVTTDALISHTSRFALRFKASSERDMDSLVDNFLCRLPVELRRRFHRQWIKSRVWTWPKMVDVVMDESARLNSLPSPLPKAPRTQSPPVASFNGLSISDKPATGPAQAEQQEVHTGLGSRLSGSSTFFIATGGTHSVVKDQGLLVDVKRLAIPALLSTPHLAAPDPARMLYARHIGTLRFFLPGPCTIDIPGVYFCPEGQYNVLGVNALSRQLLQLELARGSVTHKGTRTTFPLNSDHLPAFDVPHYGPGFCRPVRLKENGLYMLSVSRAPQPVPKPWGWRKPFLGAYTGRLVDPVTAAEIADFTETFVVRNGLVGDWLQIASADENQSAVDMYLSALPLRLASQFRTEWDIEGGRAFIHMLAIATNDIQRREEAVRLNLEYEPKVPDYRINLQAPTMADLLNTLIRYFDVIVLPGRKRGAANHGESTVNIFLRRLPDVLRQRLKADTGLGLSPSGSATFFISGGTCSVVKDRGLLVDIKRLAIPALLSCPGIEPDQERMTPARHRGTLRFHRPGASDIDMPDVFFCPEAKFNILGADVLSKVNQQIRGDVATMTHQGTTTRFALNGDKLFSFDVPHFGPGFCQPDRLDKGYWLSVNKFGWLDDDGNLVYPDA